MKRGKSGSKKRAMKIVPKIVLGSVFVGVIPAMIASCGDDTTNGGSSGTSGAVGVAQRCFGPTDPNCPQGVAAAVAAACFDGSTNPSCPHPLDDAATDGDAPTDGDAADVEAG